MVISVLLYNISSFICMKRFYLWSYKNKNKYLNPNCSLQDTWNFDVCLP